MAVLLAWTTSLGAGDPQRAMAMFVLSCQDAFEPAINNLGEIVYTRVRGDDVYIASTSRGRLSPYSPNVRFPDINDDGEVVYADVVEGLPSLTMVSTTRGPLFAGNLGRINRWGQIAASGFLSIPGPRQLLMYDVDGTLHGLTGPESINSTGITDGGEVTYVKIDQTLGTSDVFSTDRGQLTFSGNVSTHGANGAGDFIYTERQPGKTWPSLFSEDGQLLFDGVAGWPDLNDHGDIVFNVPTFYEVDGVTYGNFALVLMTSRPKYFHTQLQSRNTFRVSRRLGLPICESKR
jgi:hypothetical protein